MSLLGRELRHGVRLLWKAPGSTALALAILALGVGATAAIFGVVDAVLLKPLPFREPERLVAIWETNPAAIPESTYVAPSNYRELGRQSQSLEGLAAMQDVHANLTGGPGARLEPEELRVERASASLFPLLGVRAAIGRGLSRR